MPKHHTSKTVDSHRKPPVAEPLEARRLFAVVFDSEGFEAPRYQPGPLEGQDPIGPWQKDTARTGVATVQTTVVQSGDQAVSMTRPAAPNGDTRYAVRELVVPDETLNVIRVNWDMNVPANSQQGAEFGPFFGVEAYDEVPEGSTASGQPLLIGSLGVDAATGDVLYQDGSTGVFVETGFDVNFGQWYHFTLELDYTSNTYTVYVDGVPRGSTGFVDDPITSFTDAPLAALAATAESRATATGRAYFDNYRIDVEAAQSSAARIEEVYVSGTQWTDDFKEFLEVRDLGDEVFGYRVDDLGANSTLPWINMNQIVLRYSSAPTGAGIPQPGMILDGQRSDYAVIGVAQLSPQTYVLRLDRPLGNLPAGGQDGDRVRLTLPGVGPMGSTYSLTLNVLQGDADRRGGVVTSFGDLSFVRARMNRTTENPGTSGATYTAWADVNASGDISSFADLAAVRARLNDTLPEGSAAAAALFATKRITAEILS